ncbi:hypothetical protein OVY01_06220 [Robbsia sp. Bb-Pol-6]|uniref:Haloacid dehalogenase n=1 Tax=Robbsia betulipollinis TaxID=2981849 RepID=A0ABT3ZK61_9BURK|nr:hypothetical protein [Robbsia betulipollinis]MCY0386832.1 hypothetical protein [Robbsia betulipollinis]
MSLRSLTSLSEGTLRTTRLVSFDVFGTLIDVRNGSYAAFQNILDESGGQRIDVKAFREHG